MAKPKSKLIEIDVRVEGVTPLIMHKPNLEKQVKGDVPSPEEEAALAIYTDAEGNVIWPEANVRACMHDAGSFRKFGKITARRALAVVMIEPFEIPVEYDKEKDPEIYTVPVVIKGNRILRSRPRFRNWAMEWQMSYDQAMFRVAEKVVFEGWRDLLEYAGNYSGFGDNRPSSPRKPGPHGRFKVVKFELVK